MLSAHSARTCQFSCKIEETGIYVFAFLERLLWAERCTTGERP